MQIVATCQFLIGDFSKKTILLKIIPKFDIPKRNRPLTHHVSATSVRPANVALALMGGDFWFDRVANSDQIFFLPYSCSMRLPTLTEQNLNVLKFWLVVVANPGRARLGKFRLYYCLDISILFISLCNKLNLAQLVQWIAT